VLMTILRGTRISDETGLPSSLHPGKNYYDDGYQGKRGVLEFENERPGRYFEE
jgi:hypothetical protein